MQVILFVAINLLQIIIFIRYSTAIVDDDKEFMPVAYMYKYVSVA